MKYCEQLSYAKTALKKSNIAEYENDAWLLFSKAFSLSRTKYFMLQNEDIGESGQESVKRLNDWISRRAAHEPLQYITGEQNFMGFDFYVTPDVLIPRFDTEVLAERVLHDISVCRKQKKIKLLDMCTGSGCIGISLALLAKGKGIDIQVTAADISDKALKVAERNAAILKCDNISFIESDLFSNIQDADFDIIVSNPPYIESDVIAGLDEEVKLHEPVLALDGGKQGLSFYEKIIPQAYGHLVTGGKIYLETGCNQGEQVKSMLENAGFKNPEIIKDLAGLDRDVTAGKE